MRSIPNSVAGSSPRSTEHRSSASGNLVRRLSRSARLSFGLLAALALSGCGGNVFQVVGPTPPVPPIPGYTYLTGNWQMNVTASSGRPSFTSLAGFITETSTRTGTSDTTNAILQLTPDVCFVGGTTLPLTGTVDTGAVSLRSFSNTGQFVTIKGTEDATATTFTGTFTIGGGCSNGASGSITGTRYHALTGTFTGSVASSASPVSVSLSVTQATFSDGKGYSPLSGSATFSGVSCFSGGTLNGLSSNVIGSAVQLNFTASDGESVVLTGTFDPGATTVTIASGTISGGVCSGSLQTGSLTRS